MFHELAFASLVLGWWMHAYCVLASTLGRLDAEWCAHRAQNNIKFLSTVAMFDDVFRAKFQVEFPLAPPFWVVQSGFGAVCVGCARMGRRLTSRLHGALVPRLRKRLVCPARPVS